MGQQSPASLDGLIAAEQNRRKVFSGFEGLSGNEMRPPGAPTPAPAPQPAGWMESILRALGLADKMSPPVPSTQTQPAPIKR